ncbi:protein of unknown function [Methylocella tundrae]|uniref:Squalene cyclase C-terminal domain-containing protein n=1 Tax=Methylocella tundrae TaxID=227605 RepID=A0A4U8Z127_METTU|nr:protein of unknown function [Methylocella tundrae]
MQKAAAWLKRIQNADGGWGEDGESYALEYKGYQAAPSTSSQTAWALLGLMAAGEVDSPEVALGLRYLTKTQAGGWVLDRESLHGDRLSARLLPALSRLFKILPALGAGPLSQSEKRQSPHDAVWDVDAHPARGGASSPLPGSRRRPGSQRGRRFMSYRAGARARV